MPERLATVPFTPKGCVLHTSHRPRPSRLEKHHDLPLYLQKRLLKLGVNIEAIVGNKTSLMCESGHTDVHVALNAMLVDAPMPRGVGVAERRSARKARDMFVEAGGTVPL